MDRPTAQDKPFDIAKQAVWEAYMRVASNKGAPGVDQETLGEFVADLKNNLYKIWNRMSSGSFAGGIRGRGTDPAAGGTPALTADRTTALRPGSSCPRTFRPVGLFLTRVVPCQWLGKAHRKIEEDSSR